MQIGYTPDQRRNVERYAALNASLVWTPKCDILEFIKRCGMPDLALDTFPITAHTVSQSTRRKDSSAFIQSKMSHWLISLDLRRGE